jgi:hypothetical protein
MLRSKGLWRVRRRDRIILFLLMLLMFLATVLGLYLRSRGLHPRQLRHRLPSQSHHLSEGVLAALYGDGPELNVRDVLCVVRMEGYPGERSR